MPDFFVRDVSILLYLLIYDIFSTYTQDLHILPSKEITIMETSSW